MDDLLQQCLAGEQEAITRLVTRYRTRALDLAGALLRDEQLAEDAVQEAFLIALDRLADLREPDAFAGWLHQIVRTCCSRILRRRKEVLSERVEEDAAGAGWQPSARLEWQELRALVRRTLAGLPAVNREAARLFYLEERGCAEIADDLGIPLGTVKRRLHDARQQLRSALLGQIPEPEAVTRPAVTGLPL